MAVKVVQNGIGKMGTAVLKRLVKEDYIEVTAILDPNPAIEEGMELAEANGIEVYSDLGEFRMKPPRCAC